MRTKRRTKTFRFSAQPESGVEQIAVEQREDAPAAQEDRSSVDSRRTPPTSMVVSAVGRPPSEGRRRPIEVADPGPTSERVAVRVFKQLCYELLGLCAGHRVLDVGCGKGDDVRALASAVGATGVVYGVDMALDAIERAESPALAVSNARYVIGDAARLPFPAGRFDAVHAHRLLEEVSEPAKVVDQMLRVCASGGRIVLGEVDWGTLTVSDEDGAAVEALRWGCAQRIPSPHVGSRVATMLAERGCRDVMIVPTASTYRRLMAAEHDLHLLEGLVRARDAGRLNGAAAMALRGRLEGIDAAQGFFASLTGFVVAATKP